MTKDIKAVQDYYNESQDEYIIDEIDLQNLYSISIRYKDWKKDDAFNIGFYEWFINPKYQVFEVFKVEINKLTTVKAGYSGGDIKNIPFIFKQPPEIIRYLSKSIKHKTNSGGE